MKTNKNKKIPAKIKGLIQRIRHPRVHYVFIADENGLEKYFNELKKKLRLKLPMVSLIYFHENDSDDSLFTKELKAFRKRFQQQFSLHFIKYSKTIPEDSASQIQRLIELEINCSLRKRIQFRFYGSSELAHIVSEKIELLQGNENNIKSHIILTSPFNQTNP
nr:hypothetical protein [uncultured Carboxylicivirga sp.]